MKFFRIYAVVMCVLWSFSIVQLVYAQSYADTLPDNRDLQFLLGMAKGQIDNNWSYKGGSIHDSCYDNRGREAYRNINKYQNYRRCSAEYDYCKKRGADPYKNSLTAGYQRCTQELWALVGEKNWYGVVNLKMRMNNGEFDRAAKRARKPKVPPQPLVIPVTPPAMPSGKSDEGRHDYGTDIDDLDASSIAIMDIVEEEEPASGSTPTGCNCYGNDYIIHGLCNVSGVDSPFYQSPLYTKNSNGLYSTGDYPWTSTCQHPIGGRANLQEWYDNDNRNRPEWSDNYNNNRR